MRDDMNKVMVERERHGHDRKFREHRHDKQFQPDEVAGRESMKRRYDSWGDRKSFNENLNPLKGWLRSCVGKNWDKCYSELRQKFDARGVINNHILEHLFDYIEVNAKDVDGVVMVPPKRYSHIGWRPVDEAGCDFYVCPKSGMVRAVRQAKGKKTIRAEQQAKRKSEEEKVLRVLDKDTHLRLIDGVWFVLTLADLPVLSMTYCKPFGRDTFKHTFEPDSKARTWDQLNDHQKSVFGVQRLNGTPPRDALTGEECYLLSSVAPHAHNRAAKLFRRGTSYDVGQHTVGDRYYVTKQQASRKLLKKLGLDGTASAAANDSCMSHREAAKYRKAA